jgi:CheY-like chemotaxis protein
MTQRVLIIDDEAEIRRNLTFGLMQEGFEVTACPNGLSAIHELTESRDKGVGYDYLVTDIFMPDIDGLKILKVIKQKFPELPVLVITGFGDEELKQTALAEKNTGFLDKPFEIEDLVKSLQDLTSGVTTLAQEVEPSAPAEAVRESVSAYLTIRITDTTRSREIFEQLRSMDNVVSCDAVRGDMDVIIFAQASSEEKIRELFDQVRQTEGIVVLSKSAVERPKLDRDVKSFIDTYKQAVKEKSAGEGTEEETPTTSYIIVDIDPDAIQDIFMRVFFIDELIFCDVIDNGTKLVGMITTAGAMGRTPRIIEKLNQVDGVLRVREAQIIRMAEE